MSDLVKSYELTFEKRPEYLLARVTAGAATAEIIVGYVRDVIDESREAGNARVIIERNIAATLESSDAFFATSRLIGLGIGRLKLAIVDNRSKNTEDLRISVVLLNNRGANIALFDNIPDAEAWLLAS